MRFRGILLTVVVLLAGLTAALNWGALTQPVPISLLVATWSGPLGLVLLLAIVAITLLFFLGALIDRAAQLRQVTQLDRQLAQVRSQLGSRDKEAAGRMEARLDAAIADLKAQLSALKETLDSKVGTSALTLESRVAERFEALEGSLRTQLAALESRAKGRDDTLLERVARVRDELAADVAQAEDALARRLGGSGADSADDA